MMKRVPSMALFADVIVYKLWKKCLSMQPNVQYKLLRSPSKSFSYKSPSLWYANTLRCSLYSTEMIVLFGDNEEQLSTHLKNLIIKISQEAITERDIFTIGISGGSILKFLTKAVLSLSSCDLAKWKFFFCDERVVPEASSDSTFGAYKRELISKSQLHEDQFVKIKETLSADAAAKDYIRQMALYFPTENFPVFDLLLLGMGPDGHTCSLFPGHELLEECEVWVAPITDSPKPPPERITLTLPVLNNASNVSFVIAGKDKGPIAKKVFIEKDQTLPAARVNPKSGRLYLIIESGLIN